jgi:dTDP-4-amino-4,6-dideoxygalactose transaminase
LFYTERLAALSGFILPVAKPTNDHIWNQFTLRVPDGRRDSLRQHLTKNGIGHEIYYPVAQHQQACFARFPSTSIPRAEQLTAEVISIPVFPELSASEQAEVVTGVQNWAAERNGL